MSEAPPEHETGHQGKKILGMPRAYVIAGAVALAAAVAWFWWQRSHSSASASSTSSTSASSSAYGLDYPSQLSALQEEIDELQGAGAAGTATTGTATATTATGTATTATGTPVAPGGPATSSVPVATATAPKPPLTAPDPLVITPVSPTSLSISWPPVGGANQYQVDVTGPSGSAIAGPVVTGTSVKVTTPSGKKGVKVKARAGNSGAWGPYGATKTVNMP